MQQLRWIGHIVRIEEDTPARRVFDAEVGEEDDEIEAPGRCVKAGRNPLIGFVNGQLSQ